MNNQVVPEHKPPLINPTDMLGLIGLALLVCLGVSAIFYLNWSSWGETGAIIVLILVAIPVLWKVGTVMHDRYLHHKDRTLTHQHTTTQLRIAEIAALRGDSVEMEHTDHLGRIHKTRTISPLTIPNAPVTIKELNVGQEQALLPAPLPVAPPFSSIASQIRPGHLFLGQGAQGAIWGDITDLLSTLDVGRPGTGKSTLLRDICGQTLLIGARPIILDPHGSILDQLGTEFECAESPQDITQYAKAINRSLIRRLEQRREGKRDFKNILLLIDEMPIISEMVPDALPVIRHVVLEGRKVGIFALISGQGVPASTLGGTLVRDSMASRYVFCTSPRQAGMAGLDNDIAKSMMAILEDAGPGKAVLATSRRKPEIVAIPDTTTDDIRNIVSRNFRNVPESGNVPSDFRNSQEQPIEPLYTDVPDVPDIPEQETDTLESIPAQEREQIIRLAKAGILRREMCRALGKGNHYYDVVKQVLDEEGL